MCNLIAPQMFVDNLPDNSKSSRPRVRDWNSVHSSMCCSLNMCVYTGVCVCVCVAVRKGDTVF